MSWFCLSLVCLIIGTKSGEKGPCDLFASQPSNTPCVAAHSTVRALFGKFNGSLYRVMRASDNTTLDINVLSPGGIADAASQNTFCKGTSCYIARIYDQSPQQNHLDVAPAGGNVHHPDLPVSASRLPLTVNGNAVYGAYFDLGMGYRNDNTTGIATGNDLETIYMVTSGTVYNGGCCFDYGNAEIDNNDDGKSTMEALYFGSSTGWSHGAGEGPWIMADLENGLWAGNETVNTQNVPMTTEFVFAMLKGNVDGFALRGGGVNGSSIEPLRTLYQGPRPPGYQPMHKQGAIILGIGGDNSDSAIGTFYEGAITKGYSEKTTDQYVFNNWVAAKYGL